MSSLPGCIGLAAATAAVESEEIAELQQSVVEELGISMEELRQFIDEELEKMDCVQQRKKQLAELETWVYRRNLRWPMLTNSLMMHPGKNHIGNRSKSAHWQTF